MVLAAFTSTSAAVTVRVAFRADALPLYNALAEDFMQMRSDIKIELEPISGSWIDAMSVRFAGNAAADIMSFPGDEIASFMTQGFLLDLTDLMKRDAVSEDIYVPLQVDLYNGRRHGISLYWGPVLTAINQNMFEESGAAMPGSSWTWDDVLTASRRMSRDRDGDGRPDQYGYFAQLSTWTLHAKVSGWGGALYDRVLYPTKSTIDSPECVTALQWFADLINVHRVSPPDAYSTNWFFTGRIGIEEIGSWAISSYSKGINEAFQWQIAPWPKGPAGGGPRYATEVMSINAKSAQIDAAWEFVKYVGSNRGQTVMVQVQGAIPSRKDTAVSTWIKLDPKLNLSLFLDASSTIIRRPYLPQAGPVDNVLNAEFGPVWRGERTAQEAAIAAKVRIDAILAGN